MKLYSFFPFIFQHAVEMHQNVGEVMIANVSVGGENKKWGQIHFMSCFFSEVATPLVSYCLTLPSESQLIQCYSFTHSKVTLKSLNTAVFPRIER